MKGIFRRIRGQEMSTTEVPGRPKTTEAGLTGSEAESPPLEPAQLVVGCGQSVGKQRDHNEDALFTLTINLSDGESSLPFGLYIVADGMGGHQHGEVASSVAIHAMANHILKRLYMPMLDPIANPPEESLQEIMKSGIQEAHQAIMKDVPGGGTTMTAALILGNQVTLAHVGDSRAYILDPQGRVETITRDHSLVKRLVELGQITQEEAAIHPQRNVLYRALGQGEPFDPDISTTQLPVSGYLLLCSDGLWGVVPEEEILRLVLSSSSPHLACQRLVEAANNGGGPDNITALLVHLPR